MKRLATVLMLIGILFVGGVSTDSHAAKKKAKARTTQTSNKSSNSSKIAKLLKDYQSACEDINSWSAGNIPSALGMQSTLNVEKNLYKQLKALENSMTTDQKSQFKRLAKSVEEYR